MKDRTTKSKSPWFKFFTIGNPKPIEEIDRARFETIQQLRGLFHKGKGIKKRTLK